MLVHKKTDHKYLKSAAYHTTKYSHILCKTEFPNTY